jgi:hemoglobin
MQLLCMIGAKPMSGLEVTDAALKQLVEAFYARVRADPSLGPVFEDAVADWPEHLEKLAAFWSSVMLGSGRYKGQPVVAHRKHAERIDPALFDRWLALWTRTTDELMAPDVAAMLQAKAARIAESLQLALFFRAEDLAPRLVPAVDHFPGLLRAPVAEQDAETRPRGSDRRASRHGRVHPVARPDP